MASNGKRLNQPGAYMIDLNFLTNARLVLTQTEQIRKSVLDLAKNALFKIGDAKELNAMTGAAVKLNLALAEAENRATGVFDLSKFNTTLRLSGTNLDNIRLEFVKAGVEGRQVFDELNSFIAQTEIPIRRTSGALQEMGTFLLNSFRWSVASGAINGLTREISKAFNYALGLDKSLNSILLVTGHSTDYMREFAQLANEAARALNASTLEYTNAALIYYQQGLSDKEVAERTATTLRMALVSGESATKVSLLMTAIWNNFSNGIDNLERYADVMAGLGATTASSSGEIAKGLEKFASVAGTIGLSYDYAATAMATVTAQTRLSADSVGTSLKTLFSRLESLNLGKTLEDGVTLNKYSEALMKVGVNVLDANGQLKNMDSILEDLGGKWKNLTLAQLVALSQTVGGVRNYTTMVSLMENWDTFLLNLTTALTSNGVLQRLADIYGLSWQASKQRLQTSALGIYDTLISSDFFKGLNNVTANVLNIANNAGKTLGTPGTLAGLGMLGTYLYKDLISNGIDNAIANIWGQTQKGLASLYQTKLNNMMAADEKNGGEFALARREIMSKASNAWSRFGNTRFESPADKLFMDSLLLLMQNQVENTSLLITLFEESTRNYTAATTDFKANLFSGFSTSNTLTITDIAERVLNMVDGIDSIALDQGMVSNFYDKFGSLLSQFVKKSDGREFNSADQLAQRNLAKDLERYAKNLPNLSSNPNFQEVMKGLEQGKGFDLSTIGSLYQYTNVTALQLINQGLESIAKDIFLGLNILNAAVNKGLGGQYINDKNASIVLAYQQYIRDITQDSNKIGNFNPAWLNRESRAAYDKILENVKSLYNNTLSNAKLRYDVDTAVTRTVDTANLDTEALNNRRQGRQSIFQRMFGDGPAYKRNEQGQIAYRNAAGSTEYVDPKDLDKIKANAANLILYLEQTVGLFATNLSMATNSILMAGTSIHNFSESVKEGTATMSGFVSTTASSLLALGLINSILGNGGIVTGLNGTPLGLGKWVGKGYDVLGKGKLAALGTAETGATVAGLAIPAAVVLAAAAVGMDAISYAQAQSPERLLERVSELKALSSSFAKEDLKKLNAFLSAFLELLSSAAKLSSLLLGTAAYTSLLLTANELARNLIETYGLLPGTDYTINEAGAITFSTNLLNDIYDRVEARALQSAFEATVISGNYNLLNSLQNLDYIEHLLGGLIEPLTAAGAYDDALFELNQKYGNNVAYGSNYSINYASDLLDLYREDLENHHGILLRGTEQEILNLILQGQNILTLLQAQYLNMVNAYIGKQGDISDADKLAARALTINNLEGNLLSYLDAAGHKDTLNWFFGWGKNEAGVIYTRKGNDLVKRDDLIELYKSLYGLDAIISADVTDEQLATLITAKVQENVIADAMKPFLETFQLMGSVVSDYANAGSLSRAAFNELLQNGQEIISQEGKKLDWGSLTHDALQQIINDFLEENPQFKRPEDLNWLARTFGPYSDSAIEQGWGVLGSALQDLRKSNPNATLDTLYEEMGASFYNKNLERYGFVDSSMQEAYKILNLTAIADYADAVMKLAETVTINTTIDSLNFADLLNKSLMSNDELRMLNAYTSTIQATMGKETGRAVFEALSSYGAADRAWNKLFADALNKLDFSNNITGLASLYQQSGLLNSGNLLLTDNLDKLRKAIEKDISDKGGIGSTAFLTSDMLKVLAAVASALYEGTNVTTGDIAKMANKNATLSSYLDLTSDNGLRHYQSITDISSMIALGQVSESSITDAFRQAVEDTGGTADLLQAGLDTLEQLNLGTSYSKVDDYWQNIGISWALATRGNIAHDAPFMLAMTDLLSTELMRDFRALMVSETFDHSNTKDINNALKDLMKPLYDLLSGTAGSGKYFGKGYGGIENAFTYFSALYGDQFSARGIDIDAKTGDISLNSDFYKTYGKDKEFSSLGLYDYIKDTFKELTGATYTDTLIETFAKQMSGYIAATDVGYALDIGDAAEALNTYAQEAKERGYDYGENLDALLKSLEDAGFLDNLQYDEALGRFTGQKDDTTIGTAEEIKQGFRDAITGKGIPLLDKATSGFTSLTDLNNRFLSALNDSAVDGNSRQYAALDLVLESAVKNYTFTPSDAMSGRDELLVYDYDSLRTFFGELGYNSLDIDHIISNLVDAGNNIVKQLTNAFGEDNNLYSWGLGKDYTGEDFVKLAKDAEMYNKAQEQYSDAILQEIMELHFENGDYDFDSIFEDYKSKIEEARNATQLNNGPEGSLTENNKPGENPSPNPDLNENGETPENGSSTQTSNPSGPVSGMSLSDIDAIRGDYTNGYINDKGDYVYVGPDGTTYRAVDLNAREEYLKEHPNAVMEALDRKDAEDYAKAVQAALDKRDAKSYAQAVQAALDRKEASLISEEYDEDHPIPEPPLGYDGIVTKDAEGNYWYNGLNYGPDPNNVAHQIQMPNGFETPNTGDSSGIFGEIINGVIEAADAISNFSIANNEAEVALLLNERQLQAAEWAKDLDKLLESYREDMDSQIISPISGKEMTEQEAEALARDLHLIAEDVATLVEQNDELNEAVLKGETTLAEGESNLPVDENGNPVDENGNPIDLGEKSTAATAAGGSPGGGGGDSGNQPGENPSTGSSNSSNPSEGGGSLGERLEAAFKNGENFKNGDPVKGPDGTNYTYWENENGDYGLKDEKGNNVDLDQTSHQLASGQNNNLLPHFATGTGTIAVTGELGPELHVKPNGDMDLLGKHGREYAWVEPNDKIYTAAQTASILGSKKIREMINAHAAGINNFIPGYFTGELVSGNVGTQLGSSSKGGGFGEGGGRSIGGGGIGATEPDLSAENHRFDANWIKYRDVLERYYTILQLLEDLSIELQRFATLADRAWGRTRIDNIEKTIDVLELLVVALRAYLSEINTYLKEDKQQVTDTVKEFADLWNSMYPNRPLTFDGATFDENGVLTNYRLIVETMLDAYNMDVNGYAYASGNYSVGAAGQGGQGLFSTIAGAVAAGMNSALNGFSVNIARSKHVTDSMFASGLNNSDTLEITLLTYKALANPQLTVLEELLKDILFYTQTLNLYQLQLTVLELMLQQLFDTRLLAILVEVDYKVSIKNNALNLLDYALSKVKDDAYMAAEAVSLIGLEQDINMSILEDYEQELKDILNLNLNGELFFGSDDYKLTPTMDLSQIEKDLNKLEDMHKKFWDEESLTYKDHYIENTETGEITFDDDEENDDNKSHLILARIGEGRSSGKSLSIGTISIDSSSSLFDEDRTNKTDENLKRHSINEYNALVARMYEKYYANYSQYLPDPEEFLNYTNSKERLEALKKQEEEAAASSGQASMYDARNGWKPVNITYGERAPHGVVYASMGGGGSTGNLASGGSTGNGTGEANDLPDYLYIIKNAGDAVEQLSKLSDLLNSHTIHADIDKFTSQFKNMGEVSSLLQDIFDGLIDDFPKLGESIQNTNSDLIHFDESANKWLLDIDSYAEAMEVLELINKTNRLKLTDEKFELFKEDPMAFWEWMTDMSENFDFTNFTANEIQMLNLLSTTYLSSIANLKNSVLTQIDYLGNSVKAYAKDMDTVFNEFDHYKNLYADWLNIIDLTGRQATKLSHDLIVELNTNVVDNSINKLKSAKDQLDTMTHMLNLALAQYLQAQAELEAFLGDDEQRYWLQNIVDEYKVNIDKINKETEEAEDAYMKSWEDALQGLSTAFLQAIKDAAAGFEESFSPIYHTFDALSGALERLRNLRDLYLRPYDLAHGLSQMARDIKDSILDTDNLNSKRELKKLLDEVNDAQEEGVELSAYDLDIMLKKYDLELARAALEDAKNAKSLVRLARDNNGNWSYVYTANEDDVDEAEQKYEDAILAMELTNENYIDSLLDLLLQVLSNAEAQIAALNPSDFANEEEYFDRVKEIQDLANAQVAFIQEQMENAFANNNYLLDNVSGKAANIIKDLTTSYDNTLLAMLTSSDSIGALAALSVDNIADLANKAMLAYNVFLTRNAEVWKEAGHDISDASTTVADAMDTIGQDSIDNVDEMGKVVDRAVNAFDRLNLVLVINAGKIYDVVANYETLAASINKIIELSGEYIKKNTLTIDTNIHSWSQLEDIYSKLATDGSVWIKYLDENNEEQIKFLEAGTEDTMAWLSALRKLLADLLLHEIAELVIFDSQKEIDNFMNNLTNTIKEKGLIKLDVTGDLFNKIIGVNDTNKDIYEHWARGTLNSYAETMFGGKEKMKESLSTENRAIMEFFENLDELAKENDDYKPDLTGVIQLDWVNDESNVNHILELLKALLEVKKEEAQKFKVVSSNNGLDYTPSFWSDGVMYFPDGSHTHTNLSGNGGDSYYGYDTGGYTGRWQFADTGMYTGEWPNGSVRRNGRLAWLHLKELVLNAHDTENFLDAMEIVRLLDNLTNWMANGLGILAPTNVEPDEEILLQEVHITAEFPNATNHFEIEEAFNNLNNLASQYVHRK